jgi:hypothetical protein
MTLEEMERGLELQQQLHRSIEQTLEKMQRGFELHEQWLSRIEHGVELHEEWRRNIEQQMQRGMELHEQRLSRIEHGMELHEQWLRNIEQQMQRDMELHEQRLNHVEQTQALLGDNQVVQGELLWRMENTLTEAVGYIRDAGQLVREIAERTVVLEAGIDSVVKRMDALIESLKSGNGRNRQKSE